MPYIILGICSIAYGIFQIKQKAAPVAIPDKAPAFIDPIAVIKKEKDDAPTS